MAEVTHYFGNNIRCDIIPQGKHLAMEFNGKRISPNHHLVVAHMPYGCVLQCVRRSKIYQTKIGAAF